jgi:hypothetical protein
MGTTQKLNLVHACREHLNNQYPFLFLWQIKLNDDKKTWWRHDTQHDDTQHNDTQHNDTQHNDTQHDDTQHDGIQHNDTQHDDTQHNDTQHNRK